MNKLASIALVVAFIFSTSNCYTADFKIKVLSSKKKEVHTGSTSNFLISYSNLIDTTLWIKVKLNLPVGWHQVMDYPAIEIPKKTTVTKIISIHVPENVVAAEYLAKVKAWQSHTRTLENEELHRNHSPGDSCSIPIVVLPHFDLEIEKMKTRKYLFSGDTTSVQFRIFNLSNLKVPVQTVSSNGTEFITQDWQIPVDSSLVIRVPVSTPKGLSSFSQQNITLSAAIPGHPEATTYSNYLFDVIPSKTQKFDGFNRYPISIATIAAYSNRLPDSKYAFLYDIRGSGNVNSQKASRLDFRLRGPDHRGNPLLGLSDEYSMSFKSKYVDIGIGDHNFRHTELTESSRFGRGVKMQMRYHRLSINTYLNLPRFYPEIKYAIAASTEFKMGEKSSISAGYIRKTNQLDFSTQLYSLYGNLQLFPQLKTAFEFSVGEKLNQYTKAYRAQLMYTLNRFNAYGTLTKADKEFPGFVSNARIINSGTSLYLTRKWSIGANYDTNASNLALDTLYKNAPSSTNININTSFRPNSFSTVTLSAHRSAFEDKSPYPIFNYKKDFGRIRTNLSLKSFNVNLQAEYGRIENFLKPEIGMIDFYTANLQMRQDIGSVLAIQVFGNYHGGKEYKITGNNRFYYGGSILVNIHKKVYASIDYQSDYELVEYFRDRSILSAQIQFEFSKKHSLQFASNYNLIRNTLNQKEISVQMRYSYLFNAPLSRKKDIGSLKGKIFHETATENKGLEGITVNLEGEMTMTDKQGQFRFPLVKKGTYELIIDESDFEINTITDRPAPYKVDILPGREVDFKLKLTKSAKIAGNLRIIEDKNKDTRKVFLLKEKINKLIIEVTKLSDQGVGEIEENSNEKRHKEPKTLSANSTKTEATPEVYRIFSNPDGSFNFSDLRPGTWKLRIYKNGLPQGYHLEQEAYILQLEAGKKKEIEVSIFKKNRVIRFQKL